MLEIDDDPNITILFTSEQEIHDCLLPPQRPVTLAVGATPVDSKSNLILWIDNIFARHVPAGVNILFDRDHSGRQVDGSYTGLRITAINKRYLSYRN